MDAQSVAGADVVVVAAAVHAVDDASDDVVVHVAAVVAVVVAASYVPHLIVAKGLDPEDPGVLVRL